MCLPRYCSTNAIRSSSGPATGRIAASSCSQVTASSRRKLKSRLDGVVLGKRLGFDDPLGGLYELPEVDFGDGQRLAELERLEGRGVAMDLAEQTPRCAVQQELRAAAGDELRMLDRTGFHFGSRSKTLGEAGQDPLQAKEVAARRRDRSGSAASPASPGGSEEDPGDLEQVCVQVPLPLVRRPRGDEARDQGRPDGVAEVPGVLVDPQPLRIAGTVERLRQLVGREGEGQRLRRSRRR